MAIAIEQLFLWNHRKLSRRLVSNQPKGFWLLSEAMDNLAGESDNYFIQGT